MTGTQVVVTGAGVLTTLGDSPAKLHEALLDRRSGLRPVDWEEDPSLPTLPAGRLDFDARRYLGNGNLRPLDRTSQLATATAGLALEAAGWTEEARRGHELGLVLGTMFGSVGTPSRFDRRAQEAGPSYAKPLEFANSVINAAAGQTAIWHGLRGINATVSGGIVSGLQALAYAADLIRTGQAEVLLAGGAEELCFESFYGFLKAGLLFEPDNGPGAPFAPFDARRRGLALAEGAALLVLESAASARARNAAVLAEIRGHGDAQDPSRGRRPGLSAQALARSARLALERSECAPEELVAVSASANGDVRRDRAEADGLAAALGGAAAAVPVGAVKASLGESVGGSGALQAVSLMTAMRSGVLPGIAGLAELERDFPLGGARAADQAVAPGCGLVAALGQEGKCCSLVLDTGAALREEVER